jgi:hypothetical protein
MGIKSSPSLSSLPPITFNEQFSTLTGEMLISTGNDGGTAGLDTVVFGAEGLLYDGAVVGCGIWHTELDVSAFKEAKFRLKDRDLVCDELGRFRAGSDGLCCMLVSLQNKLQHSIFEDIECARFHLLTL